MAKIIKIWTAQMGKRHLATRLGYQVLDITAKSGASAFAPDFGEVMRYKAGITPEGLYTQLYTTKMRRSFRECRSEWESLKEYSEVVFLCYCSAGVYCHRLLFVEMVIKYLASEGINVQRMGELI